MPPLSNGVIQGWGVFSAVDAQVAGLSHPCLQRQQQNGQGMLAADSGLLSVAFLALLAWERVR